MGDLPGDQRLGHDADDVATGVETGVGDHPHEADVAAAVDETDPSVGELLGQSDGGVGVDGPVTRTRPAENAHPAQLHGVTLA